MQIYSVSGKDYCSYCDEYFKQRSTEEFQKDIDMLIFKLNIFDNYKFWKFYIENDYLEGLSNSKSQDMKKLLETIEFTDIKKAYLIYQVCLKFIDIDLNILVQLGVVSNENDIFNSQKKYFDKILDRVYKQQKFTASELDDLDNLLNESKYKIKVHKNAKSTTANFLGVNKNYSFRTNTTSSIVYKIKSIKSGGVRRIRCPVCASFETLNIDNKFTLFKSKRNNIVEYTCKHLKTQDIKKKPISIPLKEYLKNLNGIDQVDFVIWNHQLLFEKFKKDMENDSL